MHNALIYKDQDYKLTLNTGISLSGVTMAKILYTKPGAKIGEWYPSINGEYLEYDIPSAVNDRIGLWRFQAYVEMGAEIFFGGICTLVIHNNIL